MQSRCTDPIWSCRELLRCGEKRLCEGEGLLAENERGGISGQDAKKVAFKVNFTGFLKGGAISALFKIHFTGNIEPKQSLICSAFYRTDIVQK